MSADDVLPPRPAEDVELRHGYTLFQVNALSMWAVTRDGHHRFTGFDDRLEVAWHAIIEHIYSSAEPPGKREVIFVGWRAIGDQERASGLRAPGRRAREEYSGTPPWSAR